MYAIPETEFDEGIDTAIHQAESKRIWSTAKDGTNSQLYLDDEQLERE